MKHNTVHHLSCFLSVFCFLLCAGTAQARHSPRIGAVTDTIVESKVDYLEKIYFSGANKDNMINAILITLEELQPAITNQTMTPAVAAQYTFLNGIKDKAQVSAKACDITDLLAAGIYSLDVSEAAKQGIPRPDAKVTNNLGSILTSAQSLSSSANALSWNAFALSNGKYNKLGAASKVGSSASALGNTVQAAGEVSKLAKSILGSSDKPCKNIKQKEIAIGQHIALPPNVTVQSTQNETATTTTSSSTATAPTGENKTIITITGMDFVKLTAFEQKIKTCGSVKSTNKKFSGAKSTITVVHTGTTDELLTMMLDHCKDNIKPDNLESSDEGTIVLVMKK